MVRVEYMEIMTKEGKKIIPANLRYFEVKTKGYNDITIGLSKNKFVNTVEPLGTENNSVGFHHLFEYIRSEQIDAETNKSVFNLNDESVIGCGYDMRNGNVFFTKNGKKIYEGGFINLNEEDSMIEEHLTHAVIECKYLTHIEINTGRTVPFMFDLIKAYEESKLENTFVRIKKSFEKFITYFK